ISLWELIKHTTIWIANLKRAKNARKEESVDALRKVVIAAQQTTVYVRQLRDTGQQSHTKEAQLAERWTELSFALEDLKVSKLAKRCLINGKQWADPSSMSKDFLLKADAGLDRIEQLANLMLATLKR
ncbi:MAG: hypothetical protein V3U89_08310, partial [Methylophilaceae bacterium]